MEEIEKKLQELTGLCAEKKCAYVIALEVKGENDKPLAIATAAGSEKNISGLLMRLLATHLKKVSPNEFLG